ncbi:seven in absentia protein [Dictyocaulus viviparus]|uniref:E3 ubiquitin-protein ligase n=1 Tax=Dictyocaulus viviparus TaxID=29172 RepID=A0A0D8Y9J2_DICVI|nr:seven in absentia protein [Dictyocaulus viviparus]
MWDFRQYKVPSAVVSSSSSSSATILCGPNGSSGTNSSSERNDRSGSRSGSPPSQFMGPPAPNHGVAAPHQKNLARVQATAPPVVTCSPSSLSTQSVAPQIATVGATEHTNSSAEVSFVGYAKIILQPCCLEGQVLSVFECPVCLEYMLPPYLQCQAGHLVCGNCRPKLQCCPTCRGPTPSVRNLGLEKIANTVRFPCKPYSCPCPGAACKWQGALNDVMDHLKKVHKSITTLQGEDIVFLATDINLPGAVDWVMMQSCFGYNFMLVLEKQEKFDHGHQVFYAVVQLIGAKKEADNFSYRLELSTHRRRLCWEATPRSIHEGVAHAIQLSDCLSFDTLTAQLFAENGNLGINVTISMVRAQVRSCSIVEQS